VLASSYIPLNDDELFFMVI